MADTVPLNRRVDIRQEILSMEADDEALKVRECQEIKVKVQRSLKEAEAQSFLFFFSNSRWTRRSGRRRSCIRPCRSIGNRPRPADWVLEPAEVPTLQEDSDPGSQTA